MSCTAFSPGDKVYFFEVNTRPPLSISGDAYAGTVVRGEQRVLFDGYIVKPVSGMERWVPAAAVFTQRILAVRGAIVALKMAKDRTVREYNEAIRCLGGTV